MPPVSPTAKDWPTSALMRSVPETGARTTADLNDGLPGWVVVFPSGSVVCVSSPGTSLRTSRRGSPSSTAAPSSARTLKTCPSSVARTWVASSASMVPVSVTVFFTDPLATTVVICP